MTSATSDARLELRRELIQFTSVNNWNSLYAFVFSISAFVGLSIIALLSFESGNWFLWVCSVILAACFLIRIFSMQHDCGHRTLFTSRSGNNWAGRICSLFTLTPFDFWRIEHSQHHSSHGNLQEKGTSDIWLLTKSEYIQLPWHKKFFYRAYRNPLTLFVLGPFYIFLIMRRIPTGIAWSNSQLFREVLLLNLCLVALISLIYLYFGISGLLFVSLPILFLASSAGIFIFVTQHNHEDTYWRDSEDWNFEDASLEGSTVLQFGAIFDLISGNIAYHNIHHLNPKIPGANLKKAYMHIRPAVKDTSLTISEAIDSLKWKLWDEKKLKMITFSQV